MLFIVQNFTGDHISAFFKCLNRKIDRFENISGTLIRSNPFENRRSLNPIVYRGFVDNIVFLGGPSTGKSTLATELAKHFNTEWMPEYGRDYWFEHQEQHRLTMSDLEAIAIGHIEREDQKWYEAKEYLFTDTNVLTTYVYAKYYFGYTSELLESLVQHNLSRYAEFIVCDIAIPFEDTWDRSGPKSRELIQRMTISELQYRKIKYVVVSGNLEERKMKIIDFLMDGRKEILK
ncbi:AAA family ATPase [Leptospira interrogans]|uniref:AAA family ATPase n=1 Tax=Leptospira interrogans TaxID=173 RepID=UPI001F3CB2C3|nr:ATP-binding protein [Leptospira interrogans]